jgi:hypothetical protein
MDKQRTDNDEGSHRRGSDNDRDSDRDGRTEEFHRVR